jgi:hypothetical protein
MLFVVTIPVGYVPLGRASVFSSQHLPIYVRAISSLPVMDIMDMSRALSCLLQAVEEKCNGNPQLTCTL